MSLPFPFGAEEILETPVEPIEALFPLSSFFLPLPFCLSFLHHISTEHVPCVNYVPGVW